MTDGQNKYVIAAVEYVTRYAVAAPVCTHDAESIARLLMTHVVFRFGAFRELLTDNAPEMVSKALDELVVLLQARQTNPVPYRPQMIGLVERFHRTWKDCVSLFVNEAQDDWDRWIDCSVYAYNSAAHSTVQLSPNELMLGRSLRAPNELLRHGQRRETGPLDEYHQNLTNMLALNQRIARQAMEKEQARQAVYYNRGVRSMRRFKTGDLVWVHKPPREQGLTKLVHQWMGPMEIVGPTGYDNFCLRRCDQERWGDTLIAHSSFLVCYYYPVDRLRALSDDLLDELDEEVSGERGAILQQLQPDNAAGVMETRDPQDLRGQQQRNLPPNAPAHAPEPVRQLGRSSENPVHHTAEFAARGPRRVHFEAVTAKRSQGRRHEPRQGEARSQQISHESRGRSQSANHEGVEDGSDEPHAASTPDAGSVDEPPAGCQSVSPVIYSFVVRSRPAQAPERAVEVIRLNNSPVIGHRGRLCRNRAGHYVLEFEITDVDATRRHPQSRSTMATRKWISIDEFEQLWRQRRVEDDPGSVEAV